MTTFPPDFVWGTATASYQVEGAVDAGGRGVSIWDTFAHTPGRIADGESGDVAVDHYHRYAEDIALMAEMGVNAYRFSIAWPRIQPDGTGAPLAAGLDFYRRLAETCAEHGITPYATLYHWDLPQALEDAGGWLNRDTAHRFAEYAAAVQQELQDVIGHWITVNEPWCSAFLGYASGIHAPGRTVGPRSLEAVHHLMLGHGEAVRALRDQGASSVGVAVNLYSVRAASDAPGDREAARRTDGLQNRLFLDPLLRGSYPDDVLADTGTRDWFAEHADDLPMIAQPLDFVGINYYSRHTVAAPEDGRFADPGEVSASPGSERVRMIDTGAAKTDAGWEIHPDGLLDVLSMVAERAPGVPLYVTENGAAYDDVVAPDGGVHDEPRRKYLEQHLEAGREALRRGLPLRGYFIWSTIDNFEWAMGYTLRFGLVHVDYASQQRTVKDSARWLRTFIDNERGTAG